MILKEAKKILTDNGFILEAKGKTNIEDFNKMKQDIFELTKLTGTCFEFITTNWNELYDDTISQMCLSTMARKGYSYDTGRPGFNRYKKLTKEQAIDLLKSKEKEIKAMGYKMYDRNGTFIIAMPKTPLEASEKTDGPIGYWTCGVGDGRTNYVAYGMRYIEDGVEYPKNIKSICERIGERKFTMYFSVGNPKKHSSFSAMVKELEKRGCDNYADESKFDENWDAVFIATEN